MLNEKDISDNINLLITPIKGKPGKIVKSSIYLETQLLGKTLKETNVPEQIIFTEKLFEENTDACIDTNLFELGMDLSSGEQRALMSIQKLLTDSDYKGQIIERYDQETVRRYGVPSSAPVLKITPAEYYESYGIRKYDTKRGKREYSGKEKSNAMMSLMDLAKPRKLWMTKSYENEKGEHRYQLVFHEAPILSITRVYNDLKSEEIEDIVEGGKASTSQKMEYFSIKPNPLVIKDIENNFIMKSLTFIEDAKKVKQSSRLSRYEMLFLGSYLPWVARALKINKKADKEWIAVVTIESIAGRLRMHRFLETHQKKRVRRILNDAYKLAKSCGYLLDYSIDNKGKLGLVDHLTLNPEKFNL